MSTDSLEVQLQDLITDVWELPNLKSIIDTAEVNRQTERHPSAYQFTEILSEAINSFLFQMESSESPRDMVALTKGLLLENKAEVTEALRAAMQEGAIYLFPYDIKSVLEQHNLPFSVDDLVREVSDNWLFGLIMPTLPQWYFIAFVNRQEPNNTYCTGFKKRSV